MNFLLLLPILLPILAGLALPFVTAGQSRKIRHIYVAAAMIVNCLLVAALILTESLDLRILYVNDVINIYLRADNLSRFFLALGTGIWLLVTFYAFAYIGERKESRFYAFFLMAYGAVMGAFLAGNFFTLYLFYELITLLTFPLVIHFGTPAALKAGNKYLIYSFLGAALILVGFIFTANFGITTDFVAGGTIPAELMAQHGDTLLVVFFLAFIGFGVKAYIWPLFEWVPASYPQAPAPAAALLSGIVSKVAVMAIIRLSHYSFNWQMIHGTWVQTVLMWMILLTVFAGSMLAFKEKLFARRLAYSSVSQLSYVLFGIILLLPMGLLGAMLHVLFHAIIKVVLFLSQGAIEHKTGKTAVGELKGIGKSMPIVMWCFTIAALALVGIPPTGGFVSKWFLAMAGISSGLGAVGIIGAGILLVSALLTGGYLITIFAAAFFPGSKFDYAALSPTEPGKKMTVPLIILAGLALVLGMFPAAIIDFINIIAAGLFTG